MYTLKIKITKEILEKTKYCGWSATNCAFAVALKDIFPNAYVYLDEIFLFNWHGHKISTTPEIVDFIVKFDLAGPEGRPNLPEQEFDLPIPDDIINQINIDEIKPLLQNHNCLQLIQNDHA